MSWPSRVHWYDRLTPLGFQLPATAVRIDPTLVFPVILVVFALTFAGASTALMSVLVCPALIVRRVAAVWLFLFFHHCLSQPSPSLTNSTVYLPGASPI